MKASPQRFQIFEESLKAAKLDIKEDDLRMEDWSDSPPLEPTTDPATPTCKLITPLVDVPTRWGLRKAMLGVAGAPWSRQHR
jgi:hypothetical protein